MFYALLYTGWKHCLYKQQAKQFARRKSGVFLSDVQISTTLILLYSFSEWSIYIAKND